MDINALFSRETRLETLVDGWYLDKENKVIYDFKCGRYPYSKIEKLAKGCRVINDDWAGFIFPNTPGVFKIKEEKEGYAIVENNGLHVINLETMVVSSSSVDEIILNFKEHDEIQCKDGIVAFVGVENNKERVILLKNEEAKSREYNHIPFLCLHKGIAYFTIRDEERSRIALFDGKEEIMGVSYKYAIPEVEGNKVLFHIPYARRVLLSKDKLGAKLSYFNHKNELKGVGYLIKEGDKEKILLEKDGKLFESKLHNRIVELVVENGTAGFIDKNENGEMAIIFDGSEELKTKQYFKILDFEFEDGVAYFRAVRFDNVNYFVVIFDGDNEIKSKERAFIKDIICENGFITFAAEDKDGYRAVVFNKEKEIESGVHKDIGRVRYKDGYLAFSAKDEDKWRIILFDLKKEMEGDRLYDKISSLIVDNGAVAFGGLEGYKKRIIIFNGKREMESSLYPKCYLVDFENGIAYFVTGEEDKWRMYLFDGEIEIGSKRLYNRIGKIKSKHGIAFVGTEGDKKRIVVLNKKEEVETELFDDVDILEFKNGVVRFKYKKDDVWKEGSISTNRFNPFKNLRKVF
ncbi:MAG: hypothetical protein J7K22_04605 [Nanoarchaeota archaeon]|nr:hypothetical protein [Nanoarchaeota archaeon]